MNRTKAIAALRVKQDVDRILKNLELKILNHSNDEMLLTADRL